MEVKCQIKARRKGITPEQEELSNKKLQKMKIEDNEMEEKLRKDNPGLKSYRDFPTLGAFVIFNSVETKNKILKIYQKYNTLKYKMFPFYKKIHKFQKKKIK